MVKQNCWEETMNSENPLKDRNNLERVKISVDNFKANRKVLKSGKTFGQIQSAFIYRHHNEHRVWLYVPKQKNIPCSTGLHWCNKVYSHKSGRVARKSYRWLLECGRE